MSMNMRLINISMFYNYLLNATNNIFILYPCQHQKYSCPLEQINTTLSESPPCHIYRSFCTALQISLSVRVSTPHFAPFQVSGKCTHAQSALSLPPAHPLAHLASPACTQGRDREGGYACIWHMADASFQSSPVMCVRENYLLNVLRQRWLSLEQASEHWPQPVRSQATLIGENWRASHNYWWVSDVVSFPPSYN